MSSSRDDPHCRVAIEKRQIQKSADAVDVEQVSLVRPARETYRDDRHSRKQLILFPRFERESRQDFVFRDDDVGPECSRCHQRIVEPYRIPRLEAKGGEEPREVIGEEPVASNAKRAQTRFFVHHD